MAFVSFRRYQVDPAKVDEIIRLAQDGFAPIIKSSPGFIAYRGIDGGDGVVATISVFEEQAQTAESNKRAASWVKENLAGLIDSPPDVTEGQIVISVTAE